MLHAGTGWLTVSEQLSAL